MDEYGFSAAARMALQLFETNSRQTGRTARMIERVRDGDLIVTSMGKEALRLERLLKEAKKTGVKIIVCNSDDYPIERARGAIPSRVFFDHSWVLAYFQRELEHADARLERLQREMSKAWPEAPEPDKSGISMIDETRRREL